MVQLQAMRLGSHFCQKKASRWIFNIETKIESKKYEYGFLLMLSRAKMNKMRLKRQKGTGGSH